MGASVLHEDAIFPCTKRRDPHQYPQHQPSRRSGTMIVENTSKRPHYTITGVAGRKGFCAINIDKAMMIRRSVSAAGCWRYLRTIIFPSSICPPGSIPCLFWSIRMSSRKRNRRSSPHPPGRPSRLRRSGAGSGAGGRRRPRHEIRPRNGRPDLCRSGPCENQRQDDRPGLQRAERHRGRKETRTLSPPYGRSTISLSKPNCKKARNRAVPGFYFVLAIFPISSCGRFRIFSGILRTCSRYCSRS